MKKKTIISSILALLLLMSTIPLSDMVSAIKSEIWQQPIGTIIEFGSYPQSQVTDNTLISSLNAISKSWISYKYFSGECSYFGMDGWAESGNMAPKDYMKYADFSYSGNKYRAVRFTSYRPFWTGGTSLSSESEQDDNGYFINYIYYFKFEPLKWRILDPSEGYVMCENLIDNQPFNNYLYYKKDYYSDSNYSIYASDYANSSIRNWLNDNFYNAAFSSSEQEKISISECENNSPYNSKYNSVSTNDKVFLLSFNDLLNDSYGFSSSDSNDSYREAEGTDYAKCQGLLVNTKNSAWSLRSPSTSLGLYVNEDGSLYSYWGTSCNYGIRPAIKFNSNSTSFSGKCGENVFYNLNESTGLLTINGSGDMYNYCDIGENSPFENNFSIKSVVIENGVTSICRDAFFNCVNLQNVTIGNSVNSIGDNAFYYCMLQNITIPESVISIGNYAFNRTTIQHFQVNKNNTYYSSDTYGVLYNKNKTKLIQYPIGHQRSSFEIPDSVTDIGACAFEQSTYLQGVKIPNSVKTIGGSAFYNCANLQNVAIPDGVINIGDLAFSYCSSLERVTIGKHVTNIGDDAFCFCTNLQNIIIPHGVTNIGNCAFGYCWSLQSITIPDSITSIGVAPFESCESLKSITVDANNKYYSSDSYGVLYNKNKTKLIQYPMGNERISFTVPKSVTNIADNSFYGCNILQNITIPDSVIRIGDVAFIYCSNLTDVLYAGTEKEWSEINIGDSNESLTDATIHYENYCAINGHTASEIWDTVILPTYTEEGLEIQACKKCGLIINSRSVEKLQPKVFKNLKYYIMDDEVTIIKCDENAVSVEIPKTIEGYPVTYVYYDAFYNCEQLKNVTIEADISISYFNDLFEDCINLENVIIGSSVSSISIGAFNNCSNLLSITVDKNNEYYSSDSNGILYNKDKTYIIRYPAGKENTTFEIPSGVEIIGYGSFSSCSNLQTVIIPEGVSLIGDRAFENCDNFKTVYIPKSLTALAGYGAFHYSDSITDVYYAGSKQDWDNLGGTEYFGLDQNKVTIHYGSNSPTDTEKPVVNISSTNNVASSQAVTAVISDNKELKGYYFGSNSDYTKNTYSELSGKTVTIQKTISNPARYYFTAVDKAGNVSETKSIRLYKTALNANGGTVTPSYVLTPEGKTFTFPTPTREGYTCEGWSTSNTADNGEDTLTPNSNSTYYAVWKTNNTSKPSLTLKTTLNVATTQTATIIVESSNELAGYYFGTNSDYSKNTFTKLSGKNATIKKTISDSGKYYIAVADEFGNLSDVKSYRYYKTTLDANGGSVTPSYVLTASSKSFTFPTPTRSGYTCIGWAKSNTATTGEQSLTPTSNSTYYAIWKSNNPSVKSVKIYDKDIKYKDTINASPVIEKEDGAEYTVKYKSSDTSVAYIEGNGNINAVGRGDTTITVTVTDKNGNTFSDKCNVHVHYSFGQWLIKIFLFGWIWY